MTTTEAALRARPANLPAGAVAGALVLHGFTGSPESVRPLADAFAAAGLSVEVPVLPGHGADIEALDTAGFDDWTAAVDEALRALTAKVGPVVVAGHSAGGALACRLAVAHRDIPGLVLVNPFVEPPAPSFGALLEAALAAGTRTLPSIGDDTASPNATHHHRYDATPILPLLSLVRGVAALAPHLGELTCPVLCLSSRTDHVVSPSSSDFLEAHVAGPFERVVLEHSFHNAIVDADGPQVCARAVAFVEKLSS